jgi:tetratricopeptide (TPR) repeat protein
VADTAMSRPGSSESEFRTGRMDDPLATAVWRLRSRGCWNDAAALLEPHTADDAAAALGRCIILIEQCMFTGEGWRAAEDALRVAEARAHTDEERGAAACERGCLAYAATLFGLRDRADEARAALGRAAALLAPDSSVRPLLDFRRGLISQHISHNLAGAEAAFQRAHDGAAAHGDELLRSSTWRHLAAVAELQGNLSQARHGFAESLRIREELGYLIGIAPALAALADVEAEPQAARLRAEASRLVRLLGGVPAWLEKQLRHAADHG